MSFTPGIVTFNAQAFAAAYPAFAFLPQETLTNNFTLATMLLGNSYCSVVQDAPTRANLLNLITAHVTALLNGAWGKPPSGAVGRVISGTEGSVTAQIEWSSAVGKTQAFWIQTQWGAMVWQMMLPWRTARYVAPCGDGGVGGPGGWNAWPQ